MESRQRFPADDAEFRRLQPSRAVVRTCVSCLPHVLSVEPSGAPAPISVRFVKPLRAFRPMRLSAVDRGLPWEPISAMRLRPLKTLRQRPVPKAISETYLLFEHAVP